VVRIIRFLNYFLMEKLHGPGTQLMDHSGAGPQWSLDRRSVMTSPELGLMAALGHGNSPAMVQRRERSTGSPSRASPGRGRRCGDWAMAVKKWRWRCSVRGVLGRGEKRRRMGIGVVEDGEADAALNRAQDLVRRPSNDGKAAAVEVALEFGEESRRAGMGAAKIGRGPQPFMGAGGRWRLWGFKGRHQCRVSKMLVSQSEEGGGGRRFKAE
jgi:hypothetical protein